MSDKSKYPPFEYGEGYQHPTHDWMSNIPVIGVLTLAELTLPGAHNSGVHKKSIIYPQGLRNWIVCQNNSFYEQLNNGARALDLRIMQYDNGNFVFHHGGIRSSETLRGLLKAVNAFLADNPGEFIVLDFHEMTTSNSAFDYAAFSQLMMSSLGPRMIPTRNRCLTLAELKKASPLQRVMVATVAPLDPAYFNESIRHKWSGKNITSLADLHTHIIQVMKAPPRDELPWSLSATSYTHLGGPVDIQESLNKWFDPAFSDWATKCSIINADFFEESRLVLHCREASVNKALAKINLTTPFDVP